MEVAYALEPQLAAAEFAAVLRASTLGERRPVDDLARLDAMLRKADIVATARIGGRLVGVARAISDFCYCTYLSDLAVDAAWQGRGIGRELVRRTQAAGGLDATLILLAAPKARSYYPHIGMQHHDSCWLVRPAGHPGAIERKSLSEEL